MEWECEAASFTLKSEAMNVEVRAAKDKAIKTNNSCAARSPKSIIE